MLRVLRNRGMDVSDGTRERVTACADLDVLGRWIDLAFTVGRAEELFAEEG